jgi:hypothetical protein
VTAFSESGIAQAYGTFEDWLLPERVKHLAEVVRMRRFRNGLLLGLAAGYVLGARAGRERYDQIAHTAKVAWESGAATKMRAGVSEAMPAVVTTAKERVLHLRNRDGNGEIMAAAFPA